MSVPATALSIRGLAKRFGSKIAVDGISLEVPAGSFFGIVGPNGAGKTTTLSMATGLLRPDFGTAVVHGVDVWARPLEAKKLMGILPDGVQAVRPAQQANSSSPTRDCSAAWTRPWSRPAWGSCWPRWT